MSTDRPTDHSTTAGRSVVRRRYGPPEALTIESLPHPDLASDGVLIRVRCSSLNPLDWHEVTGDPYVGRLVNGVRRPRVAAVGNDVAGTVVAVGPAVTRLQVGDEVVGTVRGAWAELATGRERSLVRRPPGVPPEDAAAAPVAAVTALQAVRDAGRVEAGQQVLVIGAGGGVGTYAVQFAVRAGGIVTGVCSGRNADLVRSLGAEHVIDYTVDDVVAVATAAGRRYDVIVDMIGDRKLAAIRRLLTPRGRYAVVGGPEGGRLLGPLTRLAAAKLAFLGRRQQAVPVMASITADDLQVVVDALADGSVRSAVDRVVGLDDVPAAVRDLMGGHTRGKVVVAVA